MIQCFGLCARGQVRTVLNVLQDFEDRIQESEQSWQISAWRVRPPGSALARGASEHSAAAVPGSPVSPVAAVTGNMGGTQGGLCRSLTLSNSPSP